MANNQNIIVLIPHFNDIRGLHQSLDSIKESITVDVLVVDDGSSIPPVLKTLRARYKEGTISLKILPKNMGIEYALNSGLEEIRQRGYAFIGRLDCGDLCMQNRFQFQLEYLNENPAVKLLGTQVKYIDGMGNPSFTYKFPLSYKEIKRRFYINSMIVHPSVVFRSEILDEVGLYPTDYHAAEDYAYFMEIIKKFEAQNLSEVLITKVIDDQSISAVKWKLQVRNRIRIIIKYFYFGWYPIYGLIRNCILYLFPRKIISRIKLIRSKS